MKISALLPSTALIVGSVHAASAADAASGGYISLYGGGLWYDDVDGSFKNPNVDDAILNAEISTDTGYRLGGTIGMALSESLSAEIEAGYGTVDLSEASVEGVGALSVQGSSSMLSIMANGVFRADAGSIRPYVGAGAGIAQLSIDVPAGELGPDAADDNDWAWSAQAFAGVEVPLSETMAMGLRYRYQLIGATDFTDDGDDNISIDSFGAQSVELGLTVGF